MFEIKAKLSIQELNRFYKKDVAITVVGDSKPVNRTDYILVCAVEKNTGTYFYYNFAAFNMLFSAGAQMLTCDRKYINENFTKVELSQIMEDFR